MKKHQGDSLGAQNLCLRLTSAMLSLDIGENEQYSSFIQQVFIEYPSMFRELFQQYGSELMGKTKTSVLTEVIFLWGKTDSDVNKQAGCKWVVGATGKQARCGGDCEGRQLLP